jgi:hypothetical protein
MPFETTGVDVEFLHASITYAPRLLVGVGYLSSIIAAKATEKEPGRQSTK